MTEVSRREFEDLCQRVENNARDIQQHKTEYAVISTKLTAILWLLGAVGTAVIASLVRMALGGGV